MKTKIKISGVIVQRLCRALYGEYSFSKYLERSDFDKNGMGGHDNTSIFIAEHTIEIEVELPNTEQAQLKSLDAQENALREKFAADMMNIKVQRSKLMALSDEVER